VGKDKGEAAIAIAVAMILVVLFVFAVSKNSYDHSGKLATWIEAFTLTYRWATQETASCLARGCSGLKANWPA
jgi:hypothetical protein